MTTKQIINILNGTTCNNADIRAQIAKIKIAGYIYDNNIGSFGEFRKYAAVKGAGGFIGISIFPNDSGFAVIMRTYIRDINRNNNYIIQRGLTFNSAKGFAKRIAKLYTNKLMDDIY